MADRKIGLTIFLLKQDQVGNVQKKLLGSSNVGIPLSSPLTGIFLPFPANNGNIPDWVGAIGSILTQPIGDDMGAKSPGGLLIINQVGRTFVISFGHAWQKLEDQWLETDFGLRVALNVIPKNDVVEIKAEQVFAKWHLASERAPRASSVDEFGVDFDRDLVAVVEGVPKRCPYLGTPVRGGTSLRLKLPVSEICGALETSLREFKNDSYKKDWPDIDKINPIRDPSLISRLEQQLDKDLNDVKARSRIAMFTPSQRRGDSVVADSYVYGRLSRNPPKTPYLTTESWVNTLVGKKLLPSVVQAKNFMVHVFDEAGTEALSCTAFQCFGYEHSIDGHVYVLSSGIWYEIVSDFVSKINSSISQIPRPSLSLPAWNQIDREGTYNSKCAVNKVFLHCDAKNLFYGGNHSQFEFCDLLHLQANTLFFVKIVSKSTGMSHLVEQVRRTAQLLFSTDDEYRRVLAASLKKHHPKADRQWLNARPRQGDWNLCMVSLGRPSATLPFFAKCGLAKVYKDLSEQGHAASFMNV